MKYIIVSIIVFSIAGCGLFGGQSARAPTTNDKHKTLVNPLTEQEQLSLLLNKLKNTQQRLITAREKAIRTSSMIGKFEALFDEVKKCEKEFKELQKLQQKHEDIRKQVQQALIRLEYIKGRLEMHNELYGK